MRDTMKRKPVKPVDEQLNFFIFSEKTPNFQNKEVINTSQEKL